MRVLSCRMAVFRPESCSLSGNKRLVASIPRVLPSPFRPGRAHSRDLSTPASDSLHIHSKSSSSACVPPSPLPPGTPGEPKGSPGTPKGDFGGPEMDPRGSKIAFPRTPGQDFDGHFITRERRGSTTARRQPGGYCSVQGRAAGGTRASPRAGRGRVAGTRVAWLEPNLAERKK